MMDRCPNCRARIDGRETCRRCGMELVNLIAAEQAMEHLIRLGVADLVAGDTLGARDRLTRALDLQCEPFAELLRGFAAELAKPEAPPAPSPVDIGAGAKAANAQAVE